MPPHEAPAPISVAIIMEWMDPGRGGAETSTGQFLQHLVQRGIAVHLFTRSSMTSTPGITVHTIKPAGFMRTFHTIDFHRQTRRIIADSSYDVVHAISLCGYADIYQPRGGTVRETMQRNVAMRSYPITRLWKRFLHCFLPQQQYLLWLEKKVLGNPHGPIVVAISQYVIRQLREHYNYPEDRIVHIPNAVNPDHATPAERAANRTDIRAKHAIADDEVLMLLVAHNFKLKGVRQWMEALARLRSRGHKKIRSIVIGRGEGRAWHRLAQSLGLSDCLHFAGKVSHVSAYYHAADAFIHPSHYDPCSRVVLEALSHGLPVVVSRWDGASERVTDGQHGFVVDDPTQIDVLADRVERLLDPRLRQQMSDAARHLCVSLTMEHHAEQVIALYESIRSNRQPNHAQCV